MDLKEIEENIKNYSNEKLIIEGIIKVNDYIPEVQELFKKEIEVRKITEEEINKIKERTEENKNVTKQKKSNKLRGVLLFISIILFIDFFIYLFAGFFAIRNIGLIESFLLFIISIICILSFILILCRKQIVKKIFIIFMCICILISITNIIISLFTNSIGSIESIGKDLYLILKDSLFIIYFLKSNYVKTYLIK